MGVSSSEAEIVESRDRRRFKPREVVEAVEVVNATGDISARRVAVVVGLRCLDFGVARRESWESSISWDRTCDARNPSAAKPSSSFASPPLFPGLLTACRSAVPEETCPPLAPPARRPPSGERDASNWCCRLSRILFFSLSFSSLASPSSSRYSRIDRFAFRNRRL